MQLGPEADGRGLYPGARRRPLRRRERRDRGDARPSAGVDALVDQPWDTVVTVRDDARERCPVFPGRATRLNWSFDDPSQAEGSEEERLRDFRRVRDEIADRLRGWLARQA